MDEETLAEEHNLQLEEKLMIKGVEFAKCINSEGDEVYHLIYPDGDVDERSLSEVYARGNYTLGRRQQDGAEVMIDDDGIHTEW